MLMVCLRGKAVWRFTGNRDNNQVNCKFNCDHECWKSHSLTLYERKRRRYVSDREEWRVAKKVERDWSLCGQSRRSGSCSSGRTQAQFPGSSQLNFYSSFTKTPPQFNSLLLPGRHNSSSCRRFSPLWQQITAAAKCWIGDSREGCGLCGPVEFPGYESKKKRLQMSEMAPVQSTGALTESIPRLE